MAVGSKQQAKGRPDKVSARRACSAYCLLPAARRSAGGWTLIELVITMTVMAILSVGIIPLIKTSVKRQREYELRESLRMMRESIKEFKRDAVGMQCGAGGLPVAGNPATAPPPPQPNQPPQPGTGPNVDPRSKVVIGDCTIFSPENILQYPPGLDTLVSGVGVVPRMQQVGGGVPGDLKQSSDLTKGGGALANKKKVYLREIPIDPMTGEKDWCLHSPFGDPGQCADNGDEGIFDVTSKSDGTALDGTKYKDW